VEQVAGLEPRGFKWVIAGRLAIAERIGGYGFQHRRVRREEEILWLAEQGINTVVSLMSGNQNQAAYEGATLRYYHFPIEDDLDPEDVIKVFAVLDEALARPGASVLVHRELIGDLLVGLMGGYLVHSGLIVDPIVATSVIQEISGRPLGPEGRQLIPTAG
jgi:hypothetical protein